MTSRRNEIIYVHVEELMRKDEVPLSRQELEGTPTPFADTIEDPFTIGAHYHVPERATFPPNGPVLFIKWR
jgi:hypothetical protein